jgi:hypothetical protein
MGFKGTRIVIHQETTDKNGLSKDSNFTEMGGDSVHIFKIGL